MRQFTKDQWTDYTGTEKNFDVYVEAQKIINRGKWFFIGLFTTYAITQTALLYLIIHAQEDIMRISYSQWIKKERKLIEDGYRRTYTTTTGEILRRRDDDPVYYMTLNADGFVTLTKTKRP